MREHSKLLLDRANAIRQYGCADCVVASEEKDGGVKQQASEALKSVLERLGDFFSLLDLSFFVSGAVCLTAVLFAFRAMGSDEVPRFFDAREEWHVGKLLAAVLACYTLGTICFALGRLVQSWTFRRLTNRRIGGWLQEYGLDQHCQIYFSSEVNPRKTASAERQMTMFWAEVRQNQALAPSFSLLLRYWVMSALYDGMAIACVAWGAVVLLAHQIPLRSVVVSATALVALLCWWEGNRYYKAQIFELLGVVAFDKQRRQHPAAAATVAGAAPADAAAAVAAQRGHESEVAVSGGRKPALL